MLWPGRGVFWKLIWLPAAAVISGVSPPVFAVFALPPAFSSSSSMAPLPFWAASATGVRCTRVETSPTA